MCIFNIGSLAQPVERVTVNHKVESSILSGTDFYCLSAKWPNIVLSP